MKKSILRRGTSLFLTFLMLISMGLGVNSVSAETTQGSKIISNLKILDQYGNELSEALDQWDRFRISADFKIPNNTVSAGDVTTIKLPNKLKFADTASFNVTNAAGEVVAVATLDATTKTLKLTYTEFVESNSDVMGSFHFYTRIDTSIVTENETFPLELKIDGKTELVGDIDYEISRPKETEFEKSGWFQDDSSDRLTYSLDINKSKKAYPKVKIVDQITNVGASIVPGSIKIEKGNWIINSENTGWHLDNLQNVTDQYSIEMNPDNRGFTIILGDIGKEEGFSIRYEVQLDYVAVDGETISNKASMWTEETKLVEKEVNTTFIGGGGTGGGSQYSIEILKVDQDDKPLSGAVFQIIRDRNNQVLGEFTSDSNGSIKLNNLLKDDYTLIEKKAPQGYELLTDPIKIKARDFSEDKVAFKKITNNKSSVKNVYVTFEAYKILEGKELVDEQFEFILKDGKGQIIQTKKNDAQGLIKFDPVEFTQPGEYTFTISEIDGKLENIIYDSNVIKITVNVTETSDGLVTAVVYHNVNKFNNKYEPESIVDPAFAKISANKILKGRKLADNEFKFELKDENGNLLQTKRNNIEGLVQFDSIKYTEEGVYHYTIQEVQENQKNITYDKKIMNVTVKVIQVENKLITEVSYEGSKDFVNKYKPNLPETGIASNVWMGLGILGFGLLLVIKSKNESKIK